MASKAEEKVRLECPLCLDNFKNATLLTCGHTFCKECLEEYDEQHNDHDHLVCPVCRRKTRLGPDRVSGLTPNFAVKRVEDKLNVDNVDVGDQTRSCCSFHNKIPKDIFCVDCRILICPSCYFDKHKDHKYMKKEELESSVQDAKTATELRHNVRELQASSKIRVIPVTPALKIVRKVELRDFMTGMAALSQDAVVVGYGPVRDGADCFYVSGDKKPHLRREVGMVRDLALLTDGRSVVSHCHGPHKVYDKQGNQIRGMTYTCPDGSFDPKLCSDQHNNIYAVNGASHVFIFHGNNTKPMTVVPTGNTKPLQICVTKTGVMITSTCDTTPSTVTVFDRKGHVGTSITASDNVEYLYAAVDSQDRVLIARVRHRPDTIGLTRYTLQGLTLTKEVTFNPLKPHKPCQHRWSYMVSLTPNMIAFADGKSLYFIQINA